jgi:acyl-CoA synthetase (AMP-forming)/AMP-acid ligase II
LHALGIGRGDVVAVQLPNIPEFLIAYCAIARIGAVMSTIAMRCGDVERGTLLARGRARALICLNRAGDGRPAVMPFAPGAGLPALAFDDLAAGSSRLPDDLAPAPADPFLLLFTSGTRSGVKAVPLTSQATLGNARLGAPEHGITADDVLLSAAPYSHWFGLYSLHLAASVGATNLMLPEFTPQDFAQAVADGKPTALFVDTEHLAALLKEGLLDAGDMSSVRRIICAGGTCAPELARAVAAKLPNGRFSQLWGTTEAQAGLYTRPGDPLEVSAHTAGRPGPGTEVRVVGPDGTVLPPRAEGELQIRGSLLFPGYFDDDDANARAFTAAGWFRSGALAAQDADGNVRITGRSADVIHRGDTP